VFQNEFFRTGTAPATVGRVAYSWSRSPHVEVTEADVEISHRVSRPLYEAGLAEGTGQYLALCGRVVLCAAMSAGPGRTCQLCAATMTATVWPGAVSRG
jgi:hypothetical protein